ncbi:GntR family transcriptional regulator [Novosphingobium colocasiae]
MEGLVTIVPQVGCRARRYDITDAIDFYRIFAEGEAILAELAAERAEPNDLIALRIVSAQIGQLREEKCSAEELGRLYRVLNNRFHSELHRIARSPTVAEVVEAQRDRSDFYVAMIKRPIFGERLRIAHDEHEELFDAVSRHEPKRAAQIMRQHVLGIADRFRFPAS